MYTAPEGRIVTDITSETPLSEISSRLKDALSAKVSARREASETATPVPRGAGEPAARQGAQPAPCGTSKAPADSLDGLVEGLSSTNAKDSTTEG
jgi:hypothetical protein